MLNPKQFDKIKHKQQPSLQDVAVLIVTVEQLFRRNEIQASELSKVLHSLQIANQRLQWYRKISLREVS